METGNRNKAKSQSRGLARQHIGPGSGPDAEEAAQRFLDSLSPTFGATSGDDETDRAIDLAVDTLFVEEPETPPPETTEVEATVIDEGMFEEPPAGEAEVGIEVETFDESAPEPSPYDLAAELGLDAFKDTELEGALADRGGPAPQVTAAPPGPAAAHKPEYVPSGEDAVLRKLEEAILTLEWEISRRSVTVLANELKKVRARYVDDVTVDFAALAMRVVLDYIVKRMSRAHPESIRFLLEVTDYLKTTVTASKYDPLIAFDRILGRYESYKSAVRRAEGIPDSSPPILRELEISDPRGFFELVKFQATTLTMAGRSLAEKIRAVDDPENLIRSFRFLATRSFNRILEGTKKRGSSVRPVSKKKSKG